MYKYIIQNATKQKEIYESKQRKTTQQKIKQQIENL